MLPFKLIFHDEYDLHIGPHVFPTNKFKLIRDRLLRDGVAAPEDFLAPEPATEDQLTIVHTEDWVRRLRGGQLTFEEVLHLEIPYSAEMVRAFFLAAGGSLLAARCALRDGFAYNVGGGFHHAFAAHGEGFCAINDVALAARAMIREGAIERALVIDCDVHHGNGTAAIFADDPQVFTISIHQYNNYPSVKPPSNIDIHLDDGVGDEEYLQRLGEKYVPALDEFKPQMVVYVAGADPYEDDQLGGLALTMDGLRRRDRLVIEPAAERGMPIMSTLAGGYARQLGDTIAIQAATAMVMAEVARERKK
jgi:acetoin utilization deacetylase AcuC-like enzyme